MSLGKPFLKSAHAEEVLAEVWSLARCRDRVSCISAHLKEYAAEAAEHEGLLPCGLCSALEAAEPVAVVLLLQRQGRHTVCTPQQPAHQRLTALHRCDSRTSPEW